MKKLPLPTLVNSVSDSWIPRLVPGEVRAYRIWRVNLAVQQYRLASYQILGLRLLSTGWPVTLDPRDGPVFRAQCQSSRPRHTVPAATCSCGFYGVGVGGLTTLVGLAFSNRSVSTLLDGYVIGSVAMSGRVVLDNCGLIRAERMRIEGLCLVRRLRDTEVRKVLAELGETYSAPVYMDLVQFYETFPLNDLTQLLGEQETSFAEYARRGRQAAKWAQFRYRMRHLLSRT